MDQTTLKFECLRLASQGSIRPDDSTAIVTAAQKYYDFAIGKATATAARKVKAKK